MIIVVFRSRVDPAHMTEFQVLAGQLRELASTMPGFISYTPYANAEGERCSIHEWESPEHLAAWRDHPEHLRIQALGRERFYEFYTSHICQPVRESRFVRSRSSAASASGEEILV